MSVAGDDCARDLTSVFGSQTPNQLFVVRVDPGHGERKANHAGRANGNFPLFDSEELGGALRHCFGVGDSHWAGASVSIPTVGDDGTGLGCFEIGLGDLEGRCFDSILGEGSFGNTRQLGIDEGQIEAVGFGGFDAAGDGASEEAARGAYAAFDSSIRLIHLGMGRLAEPRDFATRQFVSFRS